MNNIFPALIGKEVEKAHTRNLTHYGITTAKSNASLLKQINNAVASSLKNDNNLPERKTFSSFSKLNEIQSQKFQKDPTDKAEYKDKKHIKMNSLYRATDNWSNLVEKDSVAALLSKLLRKQKIIPKTPKIMDNNEDLLIKGQHYESDVQFKYQEHIPIKRKLTKKEFSTYRLKQNNTEKNLKQVKGYLFEGLAKCLTIPPKFPFFHSRVPKLSPYDPLHSQTQLNFLNSQAKEISNCDFGKPTQRSQIRFYEKKSQMNKHFGKIRTPRTEKVRNLTVSELVNQFSPNRPKLDMEINKFIEIFPKGEPLRKIVPAITSNKEKKFTTQENWNDTSRNKRLAVLSIKNFRATFGIENQQLTYLE